MSKRPPKSGPKPGWMPPRPVGGPTVGLPPAAFGARPTVPLPGTAGGGMGAGPARPAPLSQAEIVAALQTAAAHFSARRFREAVQIAQRVLQVMPNQADALHLLGLVAFETEKPVEAEELIDQALRATLYPSANIFVNLGNARREQGKFAEAVACYDKALSLDPNYGDAYFHRGIARSYEADYKAARADFDQLISMRPDFTAAYIRAAHAANDAGLFRDALAYCMAAMEKIQPAPAMIFALAADFCERLTELDQAIAYAEKALALDPQNGEAARIWAKAQRRLHPKDRAVLSTVRERLEAIETEALPFDHKRGIEEELAQICDRLDDVEAAFDHFARMNAFAAEEAALQQVDKNSYLVQVDELIEAFTPEKYRSWQPLPEIGVEAGHRGPPVFLVGFPRSGTTLLDQICDAHPDIQVLEEKILLRKTRDAAADLDGSYPGSLAVLSEERRRMLRGIYWKALEGEGADLAGKFVVDKMPLSIIHAGLIARVFPEAKIILALRHPADCVLSCFMQNFRINASMVNFHTIEDAAHLYDRVMTLWQRYREVLPLNVVEVRYENLIRDLRGEVEPVLDFLGLEWNEAQADPAAHALARGTIRTPSYAQVTQPIYASAADRWRRYEKYLAPVLPVLEKHIEYFGYSL